MYIFEKNNAFRACNGGGDQIFISKGLFNSWYYINFTVHMV